MRVIDALRRTDVRKVGGGGMMLCGTPLGTPLPVDPFPGGGGVGLLSLAFLALVLGALTVWMIGRWGARPAALPAGTTPPARERQPARYPRGLPAPAGAPSAAVPVTG